MAVAIGPVDYLQHNLNPISQHIDSMGGAHVLLGLIASDGKPHIFVTGNVKGNLKKEIYEAMADLLRARAAEPEGLTSEGLVLV